MTNPHINKLAMYFVVMAVVDKFSALFAGKAALVGLVAKFKQLVAEINTRSQEVDKGTSGETSAKWKAEDEMSESVSILVGTLHSHATDKEDEELMQKSDVADSDIDRKRDAERAAFCTSLVDMVEAHKAELVDWGVSDEDIAAARATIKDYEDSLGKRESTKTGHEGERQSIGSLFRQADVLLKRQMDNMVPQLKNPEFSLEYAAARVIKDVAATRKGGGSTPPPPAAPGT